MVLIPLELFCSLLLETPRKPDDFIPPEFSRNYPAMGAFCNASAPWKQSILSANPQILKNPPSFPPFHLADAPRPTDVVGLPATH
jgi:hypothetical protein